jgi:hypothetical protein
MMGLKINGFADSTGVIDDLISVEQ